MTAATDKIWAVAQVQEKRFWAAELALIGARHLNETLGAGSVATHIGVIGPWLCDSEFVLGVEFGCGPAGLLPLLRVKQRLGVDTLADWFRKKGIDYSAMGFDVVIAGRVEDAGQILSDLDLQPGGVDLVVCCNTLDHVADTDACLAVLCGLGHKGTQLVLVYDERHTASKTHPSTTDAEQVVDALSAAGWEIERWHSEPPAHDRDRISGRRYELWRRT